MTLKSRNTFTLVSSTIFLVFCSIALLYYLYSLNIGFKAGPSASNGALDSEFSIWRDNIWTIFIEALFMIVYIPTASFYLYARFEKTPSNEVAYFLLFLLGCMPETMRLCIPLESVMNTYPRLLVFAGKAFFWGRILAFTSLFAAALISDTGKNLSSERHIFVMLIFSLAIASAIPVNTTRIPSSFNIQSGWPIFAVLYYILTAALAMISCAINARSSENPLYIRTGLDILCVLAGFLALNSTAILAVAIPGAVLLATGTFRYFTNLHRLYS